MRSLPSFLSLMLLSTFAVELFAKPANRTDAGEPTHPTVTLLGADELTESSGLAFSNRDAKCVWTHNDSGDDAVLFCFHSQTGALSGRCELPSVSATDWESLTQGRPSHNELIVADCGDNLAQRKSVTLYRFAEPDPHAKTTLGPSQFESLQVRFPSGSIDCEAIWYDADQRQLVFLAKGRLPIAGVYVIADEQWDSELAKEQPVVARQIATISLPMATGADRDPSSGDVWVASYFQAFCFRRGQHTSLEDQMKQIPLAFDMPPLRQIEAIAIDRDSRVWVTSEGTPAKLTRCGFE